MKIKFGILLVGLVAIGFIGFAQTSALSYSVMEDDVAYTYQSSTDDFNMVTLESDFRELDILLLTLSEKENLSFQVVQKGRSGVFSAISNYQYFESVKFSVFNDKGIEISSGVLADIETEINISAMPSGIYIFHIYLSDDDFQVFRINLK